MLRAPKSTQPRLAGCSVANRNQNCCRTVHATPELSYEHLPTSIPKKDTLHPCSRTLSLLSRSSGSDQTSPRRSDTSRRSPTSPRRLDPDSVAQRRLCTFIPHCLHPRSIASYLHHLLYGAVSDGLLAPRKLPYLLLHLRPVVQRYQPARTSPCVAMIP
jgi:hypothetical protein